ncbi:TlpA family protein disulfide reductase [Bradyrhizobium sp. HKCCYLS2033]|uniref:TlpA family protein disulfide reductase n=1 Tax=unclassified Bradyrhizobium TaxID=2631580 RepID=UPI003EBCBD13
MAETVSFSALTRRTALLGAATALLVSSPRVRAAADDSRPPLFRSGRSQFIVERPRNPLPPLKLQDLSGKDVTLAPKPGHVTLVNLWATWCAACKTDLPTLAALDRVRMPALDVWTICTDRRDIKTIRRYAETVAMPRLSFADPHAQATNPANADASVFATPAMPITYLIGMSGLIEGDVTGAAEWLSEPGEALLRYYLDQPAT